MQYTFLEEYIITQEKIDKAIKEKSIRKLRHMFYPLSAADIKDRFKEHCYEGKKKGNHKKDWKNKYDIREVKRGNWTPYEASVWEQHYIEKNGGKGKLQNNRNEITEKKYDKYKGKHNPCK